MKDFDIELPLSKLEIRQVLRGPFWQALSCDLRFRLVEVNKTLLITHGPIWFILRWGENCSHDSLITSNSGEQSFTIQILRSQGYRSFLGQISTRPGSPSLRLLSSGRPRGISDRAFGPQVAAEDTDYEVIESNLDPQYLLNPMRGQ